MDWCVGYAAKRNWIGFTCDATKPGIRSRRQKYLRPCAPRIIQVDIDPEAREFWYRKSMAEGKSLRRIVTRILTEMATKDTTQGETTHGGTE